MAIIAMFAAILLAGLVRFNVLDLLGAQFGYPIIGRAFSIIVVSSLALAAFSARRWQRAAGELRAQRRIEGQLMESERRFAAFFSHSPNALFAANAHSGVIIDVNEELEQLLGMPRPHLIGREMHSIGLCSSPEEGARLRGIVREEGRVRNVETVVSTVQGTTSAVLLSAELVNDGQGSVFLGTFTDISERCAREERREQQALCSTLAALMNGFPRPVPRRAPAPGEARANRYIHS
jgi:PAS domain S-box-containing protein